MKYKHTKLVKNNPKLGLVNLIIKDKQQSIDLELPHSAAKFLQEYLESNIDTALSMRHEYYSLKPLPQWTGNELRALRNSLGLDLDAFHWILGVSRSTLYNYERSDALEPVVAVALEYLVSRKMVNKKLTQNTYNKLIQTLERLALTGEEIRSFRLSQELKQEAFGTKMHWSRQQVSYIENRSPSLSQSLYIRYFYEPLLKKASLA
jgi:DNA-binding transcriptional regulator YiaG